METISCMSPALAGESFTTSATWEAPQVTKYSVWLNITFQKEESEKVVLKLNIQKTKIMASSPITSWEIVETVSDFFGGGGSKITADGDCSQEIERHS